MRVPSVSSPPGIQLLDELGRGVHSSVYKARRDGRYYAVKVPLCQDREHLERVAQSFLREATALARVRHPALPAVMEVGWNSRAPYLIMELVAGETLASRLEKGPVDESEAVEIAAQLAEALHSVHQSGLLHRDITTSNILFDAHTGAVRLIDFGFVGSAPFLGPSSSFSTHPAVSKLAGPEVDLFALGCILFESVTALSPFVGVDPTPLLERQGDHKYLQPYVSRPFASVLRRLLQLGSEPRFVDTAQLLAALRQLSDGRESHPRLSISPSTQLAKEAPVGLVGRERELEQLKLAWRTSRSRQGQVVLVRGRSGMGKTRLLKAFLDEVSEEGDNCLVFKCSHGQREPFAWVRRLIHAYLNNLDALPEVDKLEALSRFKELAGDAAPLVRVLSPRLAAILQGSRPPPHGDGAEEIFAEGLADFLLKLLNHSTPVTVVLDDVQWLDPGSRRVLGRLTEGEGARALIVLAARDGQDDWLDVGKLMRAFNPERVWELPLEPLQDALVARLIEAYLGYQPYDLDLLRFVATINDGTPLGILEILRALLDGGALVPNWGKWKFDAAVAANLDIPRSGSELLARRIASLRPDTHEALTAAAVLGMTFSRRLLASVCCRSEHDTRLALEEACGALLIEAVQDEHRFVHDSIREALLGGLTKERLESLHQSVAEALRSSLAAKREDDTTPSTAPGITDASRTTLVYAIATHYAAGLRAQHPEEVLSACVEAGRLAYQSYDNALALKHFRTALEAAQQLGKSLSPEDSLLIAELHIRTGEVETGIQRFRQIAEATQDRTTRAHALSRIVFAQTHHDRKDAWHTIGQAFRTLDVTPPSGTLLALLGGFIQWVRWALLSPSRARSIQERRELEIVCVLYQQAARLASYDGKAGHILEVAFRGLTPADRLGSAGTRCKSYLIYSFVLTVLGVVRLGRKYLRQAEELAAESRDPVVYAHMLQLRAMTLAWAGDIRGAMQAGARSLTEYGRWRELDEYCITAYNQQQIDGLRGRNLEAWKWMDLAISRLAKHDGIPVTVEFIEDSARAALVALGRERETESLLGRLTEPKGRGVSKAIPSVPSYGSSVRLFTECGKLDAKFEALTREVAAEGYNPRRVHLEMTEYYVHVAHARVHQCIRAAGEELLSKLPQLREALADLKKAARIPLLRAHALVVDGYCAFFEGRLQKAIRLFDAAQALGESEAAPWVLFAAHRGRAHLARSQGMIETANDQARIAEALARAHRATYRIRWIREEFDLRSPTFEYSLSSSDNLGRRASALAAGHAVPVGYLQSLVRIDQQTDLGKTQQAKAVVDELIGTMRAARGFLFLLADWPEAADQPEAHQGDDAQPKLMGRREDHGFESQVNLVAARSSRGLDISETDYDRTLVTDLCTFGETGAEEGEPLGAAAISAYAGYSVLAAPLIMRGRRVGLVYLDRPRRESPFSDREREVLTGLAGQVPLVFELGHSLRVRDSAEQTQRSAEKLEAIGRLAGGIAHDFNNMLSVISSSTEHILEGAVVPAIAEEATTIRSATERARDLTRQLLSFSRGQYLNPELVDVNALIQRLQSVFQRLLGAAELKLDLEPNLVQVLADPAQIDQVLTNLVVNAGDAMSGKGLLHIETRNITFHGGRSDPGGMKRGTYARIVVADTGEGMDEATLHRMFEPFFTTKAARSGTGLGLATSYGIIKHSGGHIAVESERGRGTTFAIHLPASKERSSRQAPPVSKTRKGKRTILLVDDEPLVRKATGRLLRVLGYEVISAESGEAALKAAHEQLDTIDLVLTDVVMPEMNGLDLARELSRLSPKLRILFMSGFTDGVLAERGVLKPGVMYLQKPIQREALEGLLTSALGTGE